MQHHQRKHPVALHVMVDTTRITCAWWQAGTSWLRSPMLKERSLSHGSGKKNIKITSSNLDAQQKQIFFCCCRHFFCLIFGCFMLLSFAGIGKFLIQPRDETCSILVSSTEPAMAFGAKCEKNIS
jgi:hypothetical protein